VLGNHGVVCFSHDLEDAYYKLEILDSYCRLLILAKQIGTIRPISVPNMQELLAGKANFNLPDPRIAAGLEKLTCQTDFISRVAGEVGERGKMAAPDGSTQSPIKPAAPAAAMSESEFEAIVEAVTDQIMAALPAGGASS
jgi:L-fuculose-phosphate aldolase